jgi:hypothetical protein
MEARQRAEVTGVLTSDMKVADDAELGGGARKDGWVACGVHRCDRARRGACWQLKAG